MSECIALFKYIHDMYCGNRYFNFVFHFHENVDLYTTDLRSLDIRSTVKKPVMFC